MKVLEKKPSAAPTAAADLAPANQKSPLRGMNYEDQLKAVQPSDNTYVAPRSGARDLNDVKAPIRAPEKEGPPGAAGGFGNFDPANRLAGVHPVMADKARLVVDIARKKGLDIFVTQGMRTIAEQNDLYAQGRTKAGKVVTWVRGGSSYHNYGLAVDFAFNGGKPYDEKHNWAGLVAAVKEAGLISGASYGDRPHCNLDISMTQVKAWYKNGGMRNVWDQTSSKVGGPRFPGDDAGKDSKTGKTETKTSGGIQEDGTWLVGPGDTLTEIAQSALGDSRRWNEIAEANGIRSARELSVGRKLKIPEGPAKAPPSDNEGIIDVAAEATFKERNYTVKSGDTLGRIALSFYGMSSAWHSIAEANGIKNPAAISPGQKLKIPAMSASVGTPGTTKNSTTHIVRSGDTLSAIAQRYLKDGTRWREIAKANQITNPSALRIGQALTIP